MRSSRIAVAAALALAGAARAQVAGELTTSGGDKAWTAAAGHTNGAGNAVVIGEAGWPGISAQYSAGLDAKSDLGFRATLLYGFEGTTDSMAGMNVAVPYRRQLYEETRLGVTGHVDPGVTFYGHRGENTGNVFGVGGPVGITAGYRFDDRLTLDIVGDLDTLVSFSNPAGVFFGPKIGVGGEYKLDKDLALTVRTKAGPEFGVVNGGSGAQLSMVALVGLAFNAH